MTPEAEKALVDVLRSMERRLDDQATRLARQEQALSDARPRYLTRRQAQELYSLGRTRLDDWRGRGWIRAAKLGLAGPARVVYRREDIERVLAALEEGESPAPIPPARRQTP